MDNLVSDLVTGLKGLHLLKKGRISYAAQLIKYLLKNPGNRGARVFGFELYYENPDLLRHHVREIFLNYSYLFPVKKERPVILDIGSNIGISVLFYKRVYPDSLIYCFEPDPDTFLFLKKNIESNNLKDVFCFNAGLSDFIGEADLYVPFWSCGSASLLYEKIRIEKHFAGGCHELPEVSTITKKVKIIKGSDFIRDNRINHIDILKIDAEGSESRIIRDLSSMLDIFNYIVMEFHYAEGFSHINALSDVISLFEKSGFFISVKPTWIASKPVVAGTYVVKAVNGKNEGINEKPL